VCRLHPDPHDHPHADTDPDPVGNCHADEHPNADANGDAHRDTHAGPARLLSGIERLWPADRRAVRGGNYGGLRRLLQRRHRPVRCVHADADADTNHHPHVHIHGDADPNADPDPGSGRLLSDSKRLRATQQRAMSRRRRAGVWRVV
jgi:hypothetical protein